MTKHRIRITGAGIHGMPTEKNPSGEYAIGYEFDTDADLPAGWVGRAEIVGGSTPAEGSTFVTNDKPSLAGKNKAELLSIAKAESVADVSEDMTNDDIRSAIELLREANKG